VSTAIDDELWSAVGDPTRRRMLDLLVAGGGGTATTLSERLPVHQAPTSRMAAKISCGDCSTVYDVE
jgi:DNA-binding transcriptional ArsR family regulator